MAGTTTAEGDGDAGDAENRTRWLLLARQHVGWQVRPLPHDPLGSVDDGGGECAVGAGDRATGVRDGVCAGRVAWGVGVAMPRDVRIITNEVTVETIVKVLRAWRRQTSDSERQRVPARLAVALDEMWTEWNQR